MSKPPNAPSGTGKPSGKGRGNNPPSPGKQGKPIGHGTTIKKGK